MLVVLTLAACAQGTRLERTSNEPFRAELLGLGVKGPVPVTVRERRPVRDGGGTA